MARAIPYGLAPKAALLVQVSLLSVPLHHHLALVGFFDLEDPYLLPLSGDHLLHFHESVTDLHIILVDQLLLLPNHSQTCSEVINCF
mmetsp:Transcript_7280/g.6425  ORF Transcript_7280/g.6425 Transcript_7280/m.6425 type:complete len:87 (-) Transcript_7280:1690-1950(-)